MERKIVFYDILYGKIELPGWIDPFIRIPEFVRLRNIGQSNIDSIMFKDFSGTSRWEHGVGVAYLATICAQEKNLSPLDTVHLILACLLHDVGTPPFAHTLERVLENYDHELESETLLNGLADSVLVPEMVIYASQTSQFAHECENLSKKINLKIDPKTVANYIIGNDKLGFLLCGSVDLDNADNVTRACLHLGLNVDKSLPVRLAKKLARLSARPNVENTSDSDIKQWHVYREALYTHFFTSNDDELGREAFLQHIFRRTIEVGYPIKSLIWSTDNIILDRIKTYANSISLKNDKYCKSIVELIDDYALLKKTHKVLSIPINNVQELNVVKRPRFANLLEKKLANRDVEYATIINIKRFKQEQNLFNSVLGNVNIFKIGDSKVSKTQKFYLKQLYMDVRDDLSCEVIEQAKQTFNTNNDKRLIQNLENIGNWSFTLNRNEPLHSYPATFVHSIPANLINALELSNGTILDPFGGTGQTASEAIKFDCNAISSDINSIANLITKTKFTYLSPNKMQRILGISESEILQCSESSAPNIANIDKWHNYKTLSELRKIKTFIINYDDDVIKRFLLTCFSAILTASTDRRGKGFAYFADNTPLERGKDIPDYKPSIKFFIQKLKKNINVIENFYFGLEKRGLDVENSLEKVNLYDIGVENLLNSNSALDLPKVDAIITSPPYLCMIDYSYGQRLSYAWIFEKNLKIDFNEEIGARRHRSNSKLAASKYFASIKKFAKVARKVVKDNGFVVIVLGEPTAKAFSSLNTVETVDKIFQEEGLMNFWNKWRPINFHRTGFVRSNREKIIIYKNRK